MKGVLEALALVLKIHGVLDVEEAFIDGSFAPAKKGASRWGRQNAARGPKSWRAQTGHGLPLAIFVENATPHEVKLAVPTLIQMVIPEAPQNLIGDNAYDSDKPDAELSHYGIELIAPDRIGRFLPAVAWSTTDLPPAWPICAAPIRHGPPGSFE
jgi:hypothetical protein